MSTEQVPTPPEAFPAATVVIIRDGDNGLETLLLQRAAAIKFAGGAWVFPGGRVDEADYGDDHTDIESASRRAAARECVEEAGVTVAPDQLVACAHWTTPTNERKRFATSFYICAIDKDTPVTIDEGEIVAHQWMAPQKALDDHHQEGLALLPPTYITLWELAQSHNTEEALNFYRERPLRRHLPNLIVGEITRDVLGNAGAVTLYEEDAGYKTGDIRETDTMHRSVMTDKGWQYIKTI
ncbi:hypothetical protein R50073_22400 [Maricurvus nonylphenolicus]|uniref:NUDIX hydrolase n=1 Tax=Maricurvus nonylphenolicus TaxID=1008307 RepID=UPI0036F2F833